MKVQKSSPISQVMRLQLKMIIYLTQIMYLDCVHFKPMPAYLHLLISISKPMHLLFFHSLSTVFIAKEELVQEIKETRKKVESCREEASQKWRPLAQKRDRSGSDICLHGPFTTSTCALSHPNRSSCIKPGLASVLLACVFNSYSTDPRTYWSSYCIQEGWRLGASTKETKTIVFS